MPSQTARSRATRRPSASWTGRPTPRWMQDVAREMNLSETAFLAPARRGLPPPMVHPGRRGRPVRPCHARRRARPLGGGPPPARRPRPGSGPGAASCPRARAGDWIKLDFPATSASTPIPMPPNLPEALGVTPRLVGRTPLRPPGRARFRGGRPRLAPDLVALGRIPARGFIVTARSEVAGLRLRVPLLRPECRDRRGPRHRLGPLRLGPFWGDRLGKRRLVGHQSSARGGVVRVRLAGDRAILGGRAVTTLRGELIRSGRRRRA